MIRNLQQTNQVPPTESSKTTIGIDIGDRWSRYCVLGNNGEVVEEGRIRTQPGELERQFKTMPPSRIVVEAGTHSPWTSRLLARLGHEVIVANARKVRLIYESDRKNDRLDAHIRIPDS